MKKISSAISALIVVVTVAAANAAGRPITVADLLSIPRISEPQLSPDGTRAVYTLAVPDVKANRMARDVWMVTLATSEARALTTGGHEGRGRWSPDGKSIAYTATEPKSTAIKDREKKYGEFEIVDQDHRMTHLFVLDVATKKPLTDHLEWVKFSGASWIGDQGFFYNRYPQPESGKKMAGKNDYQKIYYHKVGTPQSDDKLIYEDNEHPQRRQSVGVTEDQRFEILGVSDSSAGK